MTNLRVLGSVLTLYGRRTLSDNLFLERIFNMKQTTRHIRKQFRITYQEEKQISELMKEQGLDNFSDFLRQRISQSKDQSREVEQWFSLWQTKKLEQISRDIYKMSVLSENAQQVTAEHVRIILTCVQELIGEVEKSVTLSEEFREKYRL